MKKKLFYCLLSISALSFSQVKTPQASPLAKVEQIVGLTTVKVEYSRPSAKGRTVYGDLVPYGSMWRTGANANSIVSFNENIKVEGKEVKKGSYALYTVPKADSWEIILYNSTDNWGLPEVWKEDLVAARVTVKPESVTRHVESFTIEVNSITNDGAVIELQWEKTVVPFKIEVPTKKVAQESIEKTLAGPKASDYYASAQYYYQSNTDTSKALEWINKSVQMIQDAGNEVPYWYYRLKSLIQARLNDKKGAIETAKLSLEGAKKEGNNDYVKMNTDSINEWSKR